MFGIFPGFVGFTKVQNDGLAVYIPNIVIVMTVLDFEGAQNPFL